MNKHSLNTGQLRRVVFFAVSAFLIFGGWGVFANWHHDMHKRLSAGLTQGLLSLVSTVILTSAMETVFRRLSPGVARFMATGLGPITATLFLMAFAHFVTGTPEIVATMLPSLVVGYAYSLIYAAGLTRHRRQSADTDIVE
ncbi:MAG: hypothetical protein O3C40_08705 [Planctomycetota bacterium]|nr:hypothetical protein [Planctomycetota bacterium]